MTRSSAVLTIGRALALALDQGSAVTVYLRNGGEHRGEVNSVEDDVVVMRSLISGTAAVLRLEAVDMVVFDDGLTQQRPARVRLLES